MTLQIVGKQIGQTATRVLLNSGSYVVCHMDGRLTCIHSACVGKRIANECEHVQFVASQDVGDVEEMVLPC